MFFFIIRMQLRYAIFILIGKVFWHIVDYSKNVKTAADVNRRLKEKRNNMIKESNDNVAARNMNKKLEEMRKINFH